MPARFLTPCGRSYRPRRGGLAHFADSPVGFRQRMVVPLRMGRIPSQHSFTTGHPVCSANSPPWSKAASCNGARTGAELTSRLRRARRSSRSCRAYVTNYSAHELRKKVAEGDHFWATVLKAKLQFVQGAPRDLDAVAGQ